MSHLDPLISDLALILAVAGITTLLFKRLKQPVVLGYVVAGFLCSGNFLLKGVSDMANVDLWAQIGIIFLLFSLGLEFSFKKLVNVGGPALLTALVIITGMMCTGFMAGKLLGWTSTDSVFLGGMLSMSSTTIIIKAFDDLGLRNQRFTSLVFGVLVVEDLFAVVLMVLFSTLFAQRAVADLSVSWQLFRFVFFLVLWFVVGIYLIPTFLKRIRRFLNAETLLVVSLALCLGMVVVATYAGFSPALGAFIMGSILAGTTEAESIEKITAPVKDLFGAIFFVSVGIALFISHYAPKKLATALSYVVDLLAAIPSVIYGLWGGLVLVPAIYPFWNWVAKYLGWIPIFAGPAANPSRTVATVSVVLAVMILPIITSMSRDIFLQTPRLQEEAALALGATKWEMVKLAVLPFGKSGVVSASMLGLGRALGETMAVLMILSPGLNYSVKLLQASQNQTIAANIAAQYPEANDLGVSVLIGTGLVLFLITFVVNFIARKLTEKASV